MSEGSEVRKASVLIVDDEQDHAQVMCEALQRIGHRCDVTYNLDEARQRLTERQDGALLVQPAPFATLSRLISSKMGATSAPFRSCSATPAWKRR